MEVLWNETRAVRAPGSQPNDDATIMRTSFRAYYDIVTRVTVFVLDYTVHSATVYTNSEALESVKAAMELEMGLEDLPEKQARFIDDRHEALRLCGKMSEKFFSVTSNTAQEIYAKKMHDMEEAPQKGKKKRKKR